MLRNQHVTNWFYSLISPLKSGMQMLGGCIFLSFTTASSAVHSFWRRWEDFLHAGMLQNHYPLQGPTIIHPLSLLPTWELYLGLPKWPHPPPNWHVCILGCLCLHTLLWRKDRWPICGPCAHSEISTGQQHQTGSVVTDGGGCPQ